MVGKSKFIPKILEIVSMTVSVLNKLFACFLQSVKVSDELTKYPCQRQTDTLIDRLQLQDKLQQKFSPEDFLQIHPPVTRHHVTSEKHLAHMFVRRLMMLDCRARYIPVRPDSPEGTKPKPRPVPDIPEKHYSD